MFEIRDSPGRATPWYRIAHGETPDWDAIYAGYNSAVDWPTAAYYPALRARYPKAKFILTVRESDSWYRSALETIYPVSRVLPAWVRRTAPVLRTVYGMIEATIWQGTFHGRFEDPEYAQSVYREHIETVQRTIPAEALLVFDVRDGWAPLCSFLDMPIPEGLAFPHSNEAKVIKGQVRLLKWGWWSLVALTAIGLATLAWRLM